MSFGPQQFVAQLESYKEHYLPVFDLVGENVADSVAAQTAINGFKQTMENRKAIEAQERLNFAIVDSALRSLPDPKLPRTLSLARQVQASTLWQYGNGHYIFGKREEGKYTGVLVFTYNEYQSLHIYSSWVFKTKQLQAAISRAEERSSQPYSESELIKMHSRYGIDPQIIALSADDEGSIVVRNKGILSSRRFDKYYGPETIKLYDKQDSIGIGRITNDDFLSYNVAAHLTTLVTRLDCIDMVEKNLDLQYKLANLRKELGLDTSETSE